MALSEDRLVQSLRPDELEDLVKKWIAHEASGYADFDRNSGAGDRGIDAAGFRSAGRYKGDWDNFQCKQLRTSLGMTEFFAELGKVLYYASRGHFVMPRRYVFVAPNGISTSVRNRIENPDALKAEILSQWGERCAGRIVQRVTIEMDADLEAVIRGYDFSRVEAWNVFKLVEQPHMRSVMVAHFDMDPGAAPAGEVPDAVEVQERPYVEQLVEVYGAEAGSPFSDHAAVSADATFGPHLRDQRVRYHDAGAFQRHFRDNLMDPLLRQFDKDIYHGVVDEYRSTTGYARVNAVMKLAGQVSVSGVFEKHKRAPVSVKQGTCHHFANMGRLPSKS